MIRMAYTSIILKMHNSCMRCVNFLLHLPFHSHVFVRLWHWNRPREFKWFSWRYVTISPTNDKTCQAAQIGCTRNLPFFFFSDSMNQHEKPLFHWTREFRPHCRCLFDRTFNKSQQLVQLWNAAAQIPSHTYDIPTSQWRPLLLDSSY